MPPMWMRGQVLPFYYSVEGSEGGNPSGGNAGPGETPPGEPKQDDKKEEFDPERAMRTIENFRKLEKQWESDKKELKRLQKAAEDAESAKLSDSERAAAELKKAQDAVANSESKIAQTVAAARKRVATAALQSEAERAGLSARLVAKLADISTIEFDSSDDDPIGEPDSKSIKRQIDQLAKEYPELKSGSRKEDVPGGPPKPGNPQLDTKNDGDARSAVSRFIGNRI